MRGWRGMQETEGIFLILTTQWGRDGLKPDLSHTHTQNYTIHAVKLRLLYWNISVSLPVQTGLVSSTCAGFCCSLHVYVCVCVCVSVCVISTPHCLGRSRELSSSVLRMSGSIWWMFDRSFEFCVPTSAVVGLREVWAAACLRVLSR